MNETRRKPTTRRQSHSLCDEISFLVEDINNIFRTFTLENSNTDPKDSTKNLNKFEKHFKPITSHRLHRYHLMNLKQGAQPLDSFIKEMKAVAMQCKFRDNAEIEDRMLDQLIIGCSAQEVQKQPIGKDETLTLDQAANIVHAHEATKQHIVCAPYRYGLNVCRATIIAYASLSIAGHSLCVLFNVRERY